MSRELHCYKCGGYLGEVRDATLKKDMYHVCGKCVRIEHAARSARQQYDGNDFLESIFNFGRNKQ